VISKIWKAASELPAVYRRWVGAGFAANAVPGERRSGTAPEEGVP
jgi:hypothetical protein